jgi:hypothetical protein
VSLKGVRQSGARAANWLTREQARDLLAQPELDTMEGKRDRAILALTSRLRAAPERARGAQLQAHPAARRPLGPVYRRGPLFRRVRRRKYPEKTPEALSERMIWHIVMKHAHGKPDSSTSLAPTI